jgi:hypothetical protein
MRRFIALASVLVLGGLTGVVSVGSSQEEKTKAEATTKGLAAAREKGLDWLTKNQAANGSWGNTYSLAVTSFGCLAYLSASDEPFTDARGKALLKGLQYLLANQKDGTFIAQGHSWIHGQGFATLALSEAYGRSLFCKVKPDMDMKKVRDVVAQGVQVIQKNQSTSGGWWYHPNSPGQHEGSTTVCAVQALVSADNFGIPIDEKVMGRGFEYLKKCQTPEGGFNYQLGDGSNMKEGTAADVATLGLMKQFDTQVMIKGYNFLQKLTPAAISNERFPFYGHFYGCMGMQLLGQEFEADKAFRENTRKYIAGAQKDVISWQGADGSWPLRGGWITAPVENVGYSTAFATLVLYVPEARLSIYNRKAPRLPKGETK